MTRFQALTRTTVIATLILIGVGSVVRTSGSGLGCPDWPLCHGRLIPPLERTAIIEWSHRTVASLTGLLIVMQTAWASMAARHDRMLTGVALSTVPLLAVQAILGREAVVRELPPGVVAVHMVSALLLLGLLTVVAVLASMGPARVRDRARERAGLRSGTRLLVIVLGAVMALGAYNLASGAGFACPAWPGCPSAPLPFLSGDRLQHIHWIHRLTVVAGLVVAVLLARRARSRPGVPPLLVAGGVGVLLLYVLQALLGAVTIWSDFAGIFRSAHVLVGAVVWALAVALLTRAHYAHPAALAGAPAIENGRRT